MSPRGIASRTGILTLLVVAGLGAAPVNIAPDAETHATTGYNTYQGELAFLTDGRYPGNSDHPGAFVWPTKGNLVFQFAAPHLVSGMRLYVGGDAGLYTVIAYRGARFGEGGQTDARAAEVVADAWNTDLQENTWVELSFSPAVQTDYLELITNSGAEFYEIEILSGADGSSNIAPGSWAVIKGMRE